MPDMEWRQKKLIKMTPEQEKFGWEWKPGDPEVPPKNRRRGGLNPISGEWEMPEETAEKAKEKKR